MMTPHHLIDPASLDKLLKALLDGEQTFPQIAAAMAMSIADLASLLTSPEVRQTLETLRQALSQRSRLLSVNAETAALGALCTVMDELGDAQPDRQRLEAEKANAEKHDDQPRAAAATRALTALEDRSKQLTELSRCARATLTYARATRTTSRQDFPEQTLRLAGRSE